MSEVETYDPNTWLRNELAVDVGWILNEFYDRTSPEDFAKLSHGQFASLQALRATAVRLGIREPNTTPNK